MRLDRLLVLPILLTLAAGCIQNRSTSAPPLAATPATAPSAEGTRFELPSEDEVLPGSGPFRRADWFRRVWRERRQQFAERTESERGALVFLGDSITQGWGDDLRGAFNSVAVANRGISGDTSRGVLYRLADDVIALQPRGVVLLIGTNDIDDDATPETIASNVRLIIDQLLAAQPRMPIVLCEVFPSSPTMSRPAATIQELNGRYAELASEYPQVHLVQTWRFFANAQGDAKPEEFPDLLHPNEAGYAKWAEALRPVLRRLGLI